MNWGPQSQRWSYFEGASATALIQHAGKCVWHNTVVDDHVVHGYLERPLHQHTYRTTYLYAVQGIDRYDSS